MTASVGIRTALDKIASLVDTARWLLAEGRDIDLTALEGKVDDVCRAIARLPPNEAAALVVDLETLLSGLDRLGEELNRSYGSGTPGGRMTRGTSE